MADTDSLKSKILLIEDDRLIRELSREFLELNGFSVLTAEDGQEGLEVYASRQEEIALVILDMIMPRLGGRDCWLQLRKIDPAARVVMTTGYSHSQELQACLQEGALGFVLKPYRPSQLLARLPAYLRGDDTGA